MRSFTTPENIRPIIEEIKQKYIFKVDQNTRAYFNSDLILYNPETREIIPISHNTDFYISDLKSYKMLCNDINYYTAAAETSPGELDTWQSREKERIFLVVRNTLLNDHAGGRHNE